MISQKVAQQSLRRLAIQSPSGLTLSMAKFATPAAIATGRYMQMRPTSTTPNTTDPTKILAQQRLKRPVSPHLSIYRPQITWYASGLHRITGSIASGGLYVFATAYLVAPVFGWHLESASIAAAFGALPFAAKFLVKLGLALPVTFHSFNGVRHLLWDTGRFLTNKQVIQTGWTVVGLSTISALALALL
ncbi:succinate dehydrogenase cytochrome b560 subunit [Talaromyces stipitatus ATCC 10500]|uniref:Succinate dehydrogenase cytochrome b560 subunit n=1 Tax=Talaromyces stipitatus (strain ATCC 10500 / CBS 375.48 / QM 6759 / NRRL 1006) TaxID=441959 RepID=B8M9P0_TALSN|nr:succinate dehydrogenase cytochrome b560 subunit [Talaromyces stipitatus ATCC 10500]EED18042.1 succinate dehydrogenase cytochrome b560 subunit [Talaromyces stipitatus ATCC 10500]